MCYSESTKTKVAENISGVIRDKLKRATAVENISEKKKIQEKLSCEEKNQITVDDLTNPSELFMELVLALSSEALNDKYYSISYKKLSSSGRTTLLTNILLDVYPSFHYRWT